MGEWSLASAPCEQDSCPCPWWLWRWCAQGSQRCCSHRPEQCLVLIRYFKRWCLSGWGWVWLYWERWGPAEGLLLVPSSRYLEVMFIEYVFWALLRSKICQELCTYFHYMLLKITLQTNRERAWRLYRHFSTLKSLLNFFWEGEQKCIVPHIDFPFFEWSHFAETMFLRLSHPCMDFSHAVICTFWDA